MTKRLCTEDESLLSLFEKDKREEIQCPVIQTLLNAESSNIELTTTYNFDHLDEFSCFALQDYAKNPENVEEVTEIVVALPHDANPPFIPFVSWTKITKDVKKIVTWIVTIETRKNYERLLYVIDTIDKIPGIISIYGLKCIMGNTYIENVLKHRKKRMRKDVSFRDPTSILNVRKDVLLQDPTPSSSPSLSEKTLTLKNARSVLFRLLAFHCLFSFELPQERPEIITKYEWNCLQSYLAANQNRVIIINRYNDGTLSVSMPEVFDVLVHSYVNYGSGLHIRKPRKTIFRWWSETSIEGIKPVRNTHFAKYGMQFVERRFLFPDLVSNHPYFTELLFSSGDDSNFKKLKSVLSDFYANLVNFYAKPDNTVACFTSFFGLGISRIKIVELRTITEAMYMSTSVTSSQLDGYQEKQ